MSDDKILSEGISLYNRNSFKEALAFFLSLPDDSGADSMELMYYIGLCYAKVGRYDDALLYLEQVVTAGKNNNRILQCRYILAVIYALSGRKRLAQFELNKLLELGYRPASVYASLAYISWQQDEIDDCIDYYRKALAEDSKNLTALNGLGYVLACENRDLTEALAFCKKAVDGEPNSAACLDSLGWVYFKLGLMKEADKYVRQASLLNKGNHEIAEHLRIITETRYA
ncbi:tetratricopeptide repeat protein [Treponema parvum]|uniref:Tetratricopeptide repeat protein n=1 Tax=Treponema parvum TaxID=138851 RepID=A0A975ID16_9SPIR|nr:tetratricopeptide repeat protein [Treponema parvum]QTQ11669.1 tetratricopeptide repeat protein [Treponema parvum]QTQ14162.1 tetratricopeptide repeat protein [Treponema parvum]QTQ16387.1 tetratricopeptide repeat protein [Treponema parvum]